MKISFITTVFNEEKTIRKFLDSLLLQSKLPDEIVIVDGKSTDKTVDRIKNYESRIKRKKIKFKVVIKKGNRSVGRNEAIRNATGDIIVCSDAGNILDGDWIKNIVKPFIKEKVDVVAGYYQGKAKNLFQKCLIPYALVMPDKVNPKTFLPATRSVAFTKKIWEKVGRFDERFSHNEDYVFAKKLQEKKAKIVFAKDAIVYWIPRNTVKEAFIMFFRFALGDAESGIIRPKVVLLFARYILALVLIALFLIKQSNLLLLTLCFGIFAYILWSIKKNYRYVNEYKAFGILPLLQFTADITVMSGTLVGLFKKISYKTMFKINLILFAILVSLNVFFYDSFGKYFHYVVLLVAFFPVLLLLLKHKYNILYSKVLLIYSFYTFCLLVSFKFLRSTFPVSDINTKQIVGYAQYFGYPFYFEVILFFTFLLVPIVTFYLLYKKGYQQK